MGVLPYCLGKYLGHKWCKVGLQIGRLKVVCEALFKLRAARQQLFFKDQVPQKNSSNNRSHSSHSNSMAFSLFHKLILQYWIASVSVPTLFGAYCSM